MAEFFALPPARARTAAAEVASAVVGWRSVAAGLGVAPWECDRIESAFQHEDLVAALP